MMLTILSSNLYNFALNIEISLKMRTEIQV